MANTDRTRKLLVRTALATSTTIATVVGAQNFAMLDTQQGLFNNTPSAAQAPLPITHAAPNLTIMHVAPSITVLRQSGVVNTAASLPTPLPSSVPTQNLQAPTTSQQFSAPQPRIIRQPFVFRSFSSR